MEAAILCHNLLTAQPQGVVSADPNTNCHTGNSEIREMVKRLNVGVTWWDDGWYLASEV